MKEFIALCERARDKRDKDIAHARSEYEATLIQIAALEQDLLGKEASRHKQISACIESVIPRDRPFITTDISTSLEALDPPHGVSRNFCWPLLAIIARILKQIYANYGPGKATCMWCYFDESYPASGEVTSIVAVLMQTRTARVLDEVIFRAKQRHWGDVQARDLKHEIKGQGLLSNNTFRMAEKHGESRNHELVIDVFNECIRVRQRHPIKVFASVVYGAKDILTHATEERLVLPLKHLLNSVSDAAVQINEKDKVNLVFDEQIGVRADVAMKTRRFIAGVKLPNVSHFPLSGVSHVTPGIQLADICAYILGQKASGDTRFNRWMNWVRQFEWKSTIDGREKRGIRHFERNGDGRIVPRSSWK